MCRTAAVGNCHGEGASHDPCQELQNQCSELPTGLPFVFNYLGLHPFISTKSTLEVTLQLHFHLSRARQTLKLKYVPHHANQAMGAEPQLNGQPEHRHP